MKGLELAEKFYNLWGAPLLQEQFPELLPYLAIGLAGSGSECFGFDDGLSQDHDYEPAFCLFLPEEDVLDAQSAFRLERAYAKRPKQFMGVPRARLDAVGGGRHGVIRMGDFFAARTGKRDGRLTLGDWLTLPEQALAETVNGVVFADPYGEFTRIRQRLAYYPEDVRLKKLAGYLLLMGQAGQYNYPRCLTRGETGAAQLAVFHFVTAALHVCFLLEKVYMPYYKWSFHALRRLPRVGRMAETLEELISQGNAPDVVPRKQEMIASVCQTLTQELTEAGLLPHPIAEMEQAAYRINDRIGDNYLRTLHVLSAVE